MTSTRRSGSYDWQQPPEPSGFAKWVADHRLLSRVVLVGIDATLVVVLVTKISSGDNHWSSYFQLVFYGWLTWNTGWIVPTSVDTWRRPQQGDPGPNWPPQQPFADRHDRIGARALPHMG